MLEDRLLKRLRTAPMPYSLLKLADVYAYYVRVLVCYPICIDIY